MVCGWGSNSNLRTRLGRRGYTAPQKLKVKTSQTLIGAALSLPFCLSLALSYLSLSLSISLSLSLSLSPPRSSIPSSLLSPGFLRNCPVQLSGQTTAVLVMMS